MTKYRLKKDTPFYEKLDTLMGMGVVILVGEEHDHV